MLLVKLGLINPDKSTIVPRTNVPNGRDRSNRIIGEVFVSANTNNPEEEKLLNVELVMAGLAYHYSQYSSGCSSRAHLIEAEESARSAHRGIWVKSKDKLTPKP